ncbi:hypothetical protein DdX_11291 [Ditylenchus destructor]|uniref:Uncharacterized protein n=1 Tax=Ditylenchus destructor TaxID=166010 RepID=A0AAD4R1E9_9BILA|nr:hypothetical protein DdX_11291 [Ditylenchus destructor]
MHGVTTRCRVLYRENARLKHLRRRIPLLYIVTFTCIAIEVTLFLMFNADDCSVVNEKYKLKHSCTFTDYPSYSTKLETILDRHISKLNSFMSSPLEVRQMVWLYESDVLDAGILNHLDLKRYNVDRRTMPRKIGNVLPDTLCFICSLAFLFFCITNCFQKLLSIELGDSEDPEKPEDVKDRLQKMEFLEKKLKFQRNICAFGVVSTVAVYFIIWCFSDCWALPFQESACKRIRDLPLISTNQSTLAEAVDEFVSALESQVTKYHVVIEMSTLAERQALFNATKNEIGQLLSQNSADLVAFGALKREDEQLKNLYLSNKHSYVVSLLFLLGFMLSTAYVLDKMEKLKHTGIESLNARLKKLKSRIPLLYIATFIYIAAELALFFLLVAGIYHGNAAWYRDPKYNAVENCTAVKNWNEKGTFSDYHCFLTQLNSSLEESCVGINNALSSPVLETRQMAWHYESRSIATAIEHYSDLKQYPVDRQTMPRKIGHALPPPTVFVVGIFLLFIDFVIFLMWATSKGSVWRVFKCFRMDLIYQEECS